MSKVVIRVENLAKAYRVGEWGTGTISHDLTRWWKTRIRCQEDPYAKIGQTNDRTQKAQKGEFVWALKDIDFEVKQGEVLGIIGKNGAGKSTLLKVLSRITAPTTGQALIKGRVASLLEVGTGFHPEMTGRENIYLNGTINGMTRPEITRKLDEIVDFAGVAKYLDTPAKRYSSGMTVRLGFAVAAFLEPEILIVDEVLAVGDAEFQKKAIGKMQDVSKGEGRTVLFVSHNMGSIKMLCNKAILIKNGKIEIEGYTKKVVENYLNLDETGKPYYTFDSTNNSAYIFKAIIENNKNEPSNEFLVGESWQIRVFVEVKEYIPNLVIGLGMSNNLDVAIRTSWNKPFNAEPGTHEVIFKEKDIIFTSGMYKFSLGLSTKNRVLDYKDKAIIMNILEAVKPDIKFNIQNPNNGIILNPISVISN